MILLLNCFVPELIAKILSFAESLSMRKLLLADDELDRSSELLLVVELFVNELFVNEFVAMNLL